MIEKKWGGVILKRVQSLDHRKKMKAGMGVLFTFPAFVFIFTFMIYPLFTSLYYSFTDYNYVYDTKPVFVGFKNYISAFSDKDFIVSMKNTAVFASSYFVLVMLLGLIIALMLFFLKSKTGFYRTCIFMPIVVPISLAAILFNWIFAENFGLLNFFIRDVLHLEQFTRGWLTSRSTAMGTIVVVTIWSTVGFQTILFLAGLQSLSTDILEAARIDGANTFQTITRVILPNLRETYVITGIWAILIGLKVFVQPSIMTGGSPGNSTRVMYMVIYDNAFEYFEMGYATALGFILSIIILVFSLINLKINAGKDE
ncbi:MAG: sugar ABC transporter permease [Sphaerochaeta sp.]|nr:sugar ABC transporter permease [Sphaerochaeta sp.]